MPTSRYNDRGDTLIEILIAVVLIGVIFSAFMIALETAQTASTRHRNLVTADALLRDYAEGAKAASPTAQCPTSTTYTTDNDNRPAGRSMLSAKSAAGFTGSTMACALRRQRRHRAGESDFTVTSARRHTSEPSRST